MRTLDEILRMCEADSKAKPALMVEDYEAHWQWDAMAREELPKLAKFAQEVLKEIPWAVGQVACSRLLRDASTCDGCAKYDTPTCVTGRNLARFYREAGVTE